MLSRLLPYVYGQKQVTALFTAVLLLGLSRGHFDAPHLHVEPAQAEPTTRVMFAASGAASGMVTRSFRLPFEHR
jgi:hypothetical protein